jgi:hypothetical protein
LHLFQIIFLFFLKLKQTFYDHLLFFLGRFFFNFFNLCFWTLLQKLLINLAFDYVLILVIVDIALAIQWFMIIIDICFNLYLFLLFFSHHNSFLLIHSFLQSQYLNAHIQLIYFLTIFLFVTKFRLVESFLETLQDIVSNVAIAK